MCNILSWTTTLVWCRVADEVLQMIEFQEFLNFSEMAFNSENYIEERYERPPKMEEKNKRSRYWIVSYQLTKSNCQFDNIAMALSDIIINNIIRVRPLPWADLRGGRGGGSWLSMGRLSAMSGTALSVQGEGGEGSGIATRGRRRVQCEVCCCVSRWSFNSSENLFGPGFVSCVHWLPLFLRARPTAEGQMFLLLWLTHAWKICRPYWNSFVVCCLPYMSFTLISKKCPV